MSPNADWVGRVNAPLMTKAQQIEHWQQRYFLLLDEHAALINQLQEIRRILDAPLPPNGRSGT